MWNRQLETLSRGELDQLQVERLRSTIERVGTAVPFYNKVLAATSFKPEQLQTPADINRLPFTTKTDLRDAYPFGLLAVERSAVRRIHASSGTRGKPTIALYNQADLDLWADLCARSLAAAGVNPGDVVQNTYGYGLFTGGLGLHYGVEKLGATIVPASAGRTQQQVMLLQDFGVRAFLGTPSYALNIAMTMQEMGVKNDSLALEIAILGAEPWTEKCREQVENRLGVKAFNIYGLSEILGPGVAMECIAQEGMHIWEDHFIPEIINPETMQAVAEGESGELILTTVTKEASPLLRYRTGDICAFVSGPCTCGRTSRRITRIQGRRDDMLVVRGVNFYPSEVEHILFEQTELAPHYLVIVGREQALDTISLRVELSPETQATWRQEKTEEINRRQLEQTLTNLLKDKMGLTSIVEVLDPQTLARSEGKALRVVDLRPS